MSLSHSATIATVVEEFTRFYAARGPLSGAAGPNNRIIKFLAARNENLTAYHLGYLPYLARIVENDDATAVLAIAWVLHCHGREIKIHFNGTHLYFSCNGVFYDSLNPKGTSRETDVFGWREGVKPITIPFKDCFNRYMVNDEDGILLMNEFIRNARVNSFLYRHTADDYLELISPGYCKSLYPGQEVSQFAM